MQLIYYPDPILSDMCYTIDSTTIQKVKNRKTSTVVMFIKLATEMFEVMNKNNGVGLAAPQVGLNIRIFVWKQNDQNHMVCNPTLSNLKGNIKVKEGCLSLPGVNVTVQRAISSTLHGVGIDGKPFSLVGNSSVTQIWQHEIDHLDGKLIIDSMSLENGTLNKSALEVLKTNSRT